MNHKFDVSIIIACYNEEELLEKNVDEICRTMRQTRYSYELIFVDDFSKDKTCEIIKNICENNNNTSYIFHEKNYGRGKTVRDGFIQASGKYIGFIDIDLEVHSRYIPSMIEALENNFEAATAYRVYKIDFSYTCILRHIISAGYRKLVKLITNIQTRDTETGYKFFKREAVMPLIEKSVFDGWFWDTEIMYLCERTNLKIKEIECLFLRNNEKISKLKVLPDTIKYIKNIIEFKKFYK